VTSEVTRVNSTSRDEAHAATARLVSGHFPGAARHEPGSDLVPHAPGNAQPQKVLRVGLAEAPDILDPTLARTFVGRIVFASLCDNLYDIDGNLHIVPQLATSLPQYQASCGSRAVRS